MSKGKLTETNNLAVVCPEIAKQWHPTKNGDLRPEMVMPHCGKKIWWICDKGHEWETKVNTRYTTRDGKIGIAGCPYCSPKNAKILKGYNDLATRNPEIAKQWHPTKNGDITPDTVGSYSNKRAWWICDKGHEWETIIAHRSLGVGCPYCAKRGRRKKVKSEENE